MDYSIFEGKRILITGATGLIGKTLVKMLLQINKRLSNKIIVIAVSRSPERAQSVFKDCMCDELEILVTDVCNFEYPKAKVDYIVHGASQTASKAFVSNPVETIMTAFEGTRNMLEFAAENNVKGFVYLSSMEVYGTPDSDEKIDENHPTNINTMSVRSCYPESKRMCENLCCSYASQYGVPAMAVRLTQTFGPGVDHRENRVFAMIARSAIEKKNIVLNTKGETKHNYLYTEDAATAILTVLAKGKPGEVYNAANEETYCSIYEMAKLVADSFGENKVSVETNDDENISKFGYAPTMHMNLDASKLRGLGWKPEVDLVGMYRNMIEDMIKQQN